MIPASELEAPRYAPAAATPDEKYLSTSAAYDVAYEVLYETLPACRSCGCGGC